MEKNLPFKVEGITWHALTLEPEAFAQIKQMMTEQFGIPLQMDFDGVLVFGMNNGTSLELYDPSKVPPYGYNDSVAFGFRVSDIEAASAALEKAGFELLGEITRVEQFKYAYRHFKGKDGKVYGLNEQK
ncbi:MAG TPA: VOC family protein [Candidatus Kapabacteria bacterium]|nr:VOC family protein [Candidatus Kapabacteria bacterium]